MRCSASKVAAAASLSGAAFEIVEPPSSRVKAASSPPPFLLEIANSSSDCSAAALGAPESDSGSVARQRHRGERALRRAACAEETREPSARREAAVLHQILRLKVRARVTFATRAVDDREVAFLPRGFERAEIWVQAERVVEPHGVLRFHGEARAEFVVVVVRDRGDEREPVGGAAEEDDDERARVVARRWRCWRQCSCQQR